MTFEIVSNDMLGGNKTYNKIEHVVRPTLHNAICYLNADRSNRGTENFHRKWFQDIDVLSYNKPFSRHIDGTDHTHFVLDIDIRLRYEKDENKFDKYKENLRLLKLEAGIEYFKLWKDLFPNHIFFWKIGGTGLHAIQRINERVSRKKLKSLVINNLFTPCQKVDLEDDVVTLEDYRKSHRCNKDCDGWHVPYEKKEETKGSGIFYYYRSDIFWTKLIEFKGRQFSLNIDLGYYDHEIKLLRWIYSPYFGVPTKTYFSIPIKKWDMKWIEKYSTNQHIDEVIEDVEIPEFSFYPYVTFDDEEMMGSEEEWIKKKSPKTNKETKDGMYEYHSKYSEKYQKVKLYGVDDHDNLPFSLTQKMAQMTREFNRKDISLCLRAHYIKAASQRGSHFNRFPIIRYLLNQGYNIHQVANWIRFELNDSTDNEIHNRHKLMDNLPVVIGNPDDPDPVPGCLAMQKVGGKMHVCGEEMIASCGRRHPLSKEKLNKHKAINLDEIKDQISNVSGTSDKEIFWNNIVEKVDQAIHMNKNLVMWKATRAGVTTSMIYSCFIRNKKLLVLVPTNKIAIDTFSKAMNIVKDKTGKELRGAVLASNRRSCLLLKFTSYDLRVRKISNPDWGDDRVAWDSLLYHSKPSCNKCRYREATINFPLKNSKGELIPLHSSKMLSVNERTGWCAYQTFRKQLPNLDVVFLTYSKILSMRSSGGDENAEILSALRTEFDLVFLDEINTIAQSSPTVVKLLENHGDVIDYGQPMIYDIFSRLRLELDELKNFAENKRTQEIDVIIRKFITRFEPLKMKNWENVNVMNNIYDIVHDAPPDPMFKHPLDTQQRARLRDRFNLYHTIIENYSKQHNKNLSCIEKVLSILVYDEFVGYNHTSYESSYLNYIFVVSPVVRELRGFVREFSRLGSHKQIIATDACLPEANISDLLGVKFQDFIVGDPRETNKHQLIVTDAKQIFIHQFLKGRKCTQYKCEYWKNDKMNCGLELYHNREKDGEIKLMVEKALYKGKCQKDKFLFLRDVQSVVKAYGAENIFLIFPNKKSHYWFQRVRYKIDNHKQLKYSYFRSDLTIGVECDRRIMITLGSPIPPKNSYLWLAHYYHRLNLLTDYTLTELAEKLRINNMRSSLWQTIGRAKDPVGEKRSFVLCWGMGIDTLIQSFTFDKIMKDSLPKYLAVDTRKYAVTSLMQVTDIWRKMGRIIDPALIKLKDRLTKNGYSDKWFSQRELHNKFGTRYHLVEDLMRDYTSEDLAYFNLEIKKEGYGKRHLYSIRTIMPQ